MNEPLEVGDAVIVKNRSSPFAGLRGEVQAIAGKVATVSRWADDRLAIVPLPFRLEELRALTPQDLDS